MRSARPRRIFGFAALLTSAVCTVASPAGADPASPSSSPAATVEAPLPEEAAPTSGEAEVPVPPEDPRPFRPPSFPKMLLLDAGHVLTSPVRWRGHEWLVFSASTAGLAALSLADESLSDSARERGPSLGFAGNTLEGMGDGRSFVLLGGFYLAGLIGKDSNAKNVCLDGLSASLLAAGIVTPVLATVVGRERPTTGQGAYSFRPFEGRAFPSGHATQAFAVASVIATSYDQLWVKATAYGAATVAAYIRVRRGKHFPTDVVAGAVIGTVVGRSVVHFNRKLRSGEREPEDAGARLALSPLLGGGTYGVSASLTF